MKCVVANCSSSNNGKACDCSFFRFPVCSALQKKWINFCGNVKVKPKTSYICMLHFKTEDFENNLQYEMGFSKKRFLKRGAVPSIFCPTLGNCKLSDERAARINKRENKKTVDTLLKEYNTLAVDNEPEAYLHDEHENLALLKNSDEKENIEEINLSVSNENVKDLKFQLKSLKKQLKSSKIKHAAELKCLKQKLERKDRIHEFQMDEYEKRLTKAKMELQTLEEKLGSIFTKGQVKNLKSNVKRATWAEEDIAQSITLHAASSKLYKLLYRKGFPLPAIRTLQKWAQKVNITRGLIQPVFKLLSASTHMTELHKICILSFDEIKIRRTYCYDKSTDTTLAPVSYAQVAMIRGLMAKWKQPIFFDFDCPITKDVLFSILQKIESCGYNAVAMVSDLGGGNRSLLNALGISEEHPWFTFNDRKVFAFADVPHLIKLLRNHFIDKGFIINGKCVNKEIILKLLDASSDDLKITHKISEVNVNVSGAQRQNVKLATKLFSHTVAQAISRAASHGWLEDLNWSECFQLFKMTNDWFDVHNVRVPRADSRRRRYAYGLALEEQNKILDEMTELMQNMRAVGRQSLLPFQKGIIQSNNALKGLFAELKARYKWEFILTYRLNQDVLENFFGIIRSKGGLHDHPDQQEFKYRLRSYILGHNDGVISNAANVEIDDTPDIDRSEKSLTGLIFTNIVAKNEKKTNTHEDDSFVDDELDDLAYDGLENFAGYICHKLKNEVPNIAESRQEPQTFTWVDHLSEGGLSKPSAEMMTDMQALHAIFQKNNADTLLITKDFLKIHLEQAHEIKCSEKVKTLFFRARMFFRIRSLNRQIIEQTKQRKRKWEKVLQ